MYGMGHKPKDRQVDDGVLGQHLALSVAAHLARTQLVSNPLDIHDARHLSDMLDVVANALARAAPFYVQDAGGGPAHELSPAELEGATVLRGATVLALKDGRMLTGVSIKRADLRQAVAILKSVGIPELRTAPPKEANVEAPTLRAQVAELEALLRQPLIAPHVAKANALAVAIARHARDGRVANLAMQLVSAVHEAKSDAEGETHPVAVALARLRAGLEQGEGAKS
jgi:hypothetical protein